MVLSLKPFGCMPSSQSDGVQSAVMNHFKDMIFLPIETSGEGEINAHSRVQMALGEAKSKARTEFQQVLESTGKPLADVRAFVADRPELRRPFYHVPHHDGVIRRRGAVRPARLRADGPAPAAVPARDLVDGGGAVMAAPQFLVGIDVGSTTVKAVVVDAVTDRTIRADEVVWADYQRHETKQSVSCAGR
jgi:hypothetical protein